MQAGNSLTVESVPSTLSDFRTQLQTVKPYLFALADQLIEAAPRKNWDLILGDDKGGRIVTFFVRRVLENAGHKTPTFFVLGSSITREHFGADAYEDYFRYIASSLGSQSLNTLIVTESTSSGRTIDWLAERLAPVSASVECATVTNKFPNRYRPEYAGASGYEAAARSFYTFEAVPRGGLVGRAAKLARSFQDRLPYGIARRLPRLPTAGVNDPVGSALIGLAVDTDTPRPVSCRPRPNQHTAEAYKEMQALIDEYTAARSLAVEPQPLADMLEERQLVGV
jgi:hypothetical protein